MKRFICILITVVIALSGSMADGKRKGKKQSGEGKPTTGYVYICTGPKASTYHRTPNCSGLNRCSTSVKKVSGSSVSGRRPCRKCY